MKKSIAILLALMTICLFSITGCGDSGDTADNTEDKGPQLGKVEADPEGTIMPFALTLGSDKDGVINFTETDEGAACEQWDAESKEFGEAKLYTKTVTIFKNRII